MEGASPKEPWGRTDAVCETLARQGRIALGIWSLGQRRPQPDWTPQDVWCPSLILDGQLLLPSQACLLALPHTVCLRTWELSVGFLNLLLFCNLLQGIGHGPGLDLRWLGSSVTKSTAPIFSGCVDGGRETHHSHLGAEKPLEDLVWRRPGSLLVSWLCSMGKLDSGDLCILFRSTGDVL